jgi:hypothetical protein
LKRAADMLEVEEQGRDDRVQKQTATSDRFVDITFVSDYHLVE